MKANESGADLSTYGDVGIQEALCDVNLTTNILIFFC